MIRVAFREICVLLLGVVVSFLVSLAGDAGRNFGAVTAAIVLPIVFCLARAALANGAFANLSILRRLGTQFSLGFALISLLVFEMALRCSPVFGTFLLARGLSCSCLALGMFAFSYLRMLSRTAVDTRCDWHGQPRSETPKRAFRVRLDVHARA